MNRTSLSTAIAAAMALSATAHAGHSSPICVNALDPVLGVVAGNVCEFDWNSQASAIAEGQGPFGSTLSVSQNITFKYQANLVAFNPNPLGPPVSGPIAGLNGVGGTAADAYEYTIVANFVEHVDTSSAGNTIVFTPVGGKIAIFYDSYGGAGSCDGSQSNAGVGTGYVDGCKILEMTVTGGTSTFTQTGANSGIGGTEYDFNIVASPDFVNSAYVIGTLGDLVMDIHLSSSQNFPPTVTPSFYFGGPPVGGNPPAFATYTTDTTCAGSNTCDLVLKFDASNTFTTTPEPSSLLLIGAGLSGLGLLSRRRKQRLAD